MELVPVSSYGAHDVPLVPGDVVINMADLVEPVLDPEAIPLEFGRDAIPIELIGARFRPATHDPILILRHLNRPDRSPLTEAEQRIFDRARATDRAATRLLVGLAAPAIVLGAGATLLTLGGLGVVANPALAGYTIVWTAVGGFFLSAVGQGVSYLATGALPHVASETANEAQNALGGVRDFFNALARRLAELLHDDDPFVAGEAEEVVRAIDVHALQGRVEAATGMGTAADRVVNAFEVLQAHVNGRDGDVLDYYGIKNDIDRARRG